MLYHGSKTAGLQILKPSPHTILEGDSVVFATPDIRFALAMIHGTDNDIVVGYTVDTITQDEYMYIEEQYPDALNVLAAPGVIYTLPDTGFVSDHRLSHNELMSHEEVLVSSETDIPDVLAALRAYNIEFRPFGRTGVSQPLP